MSTPIFNIADLRDELEVADGYIQMDSTMERLVLLATANLEKYIDASFTYGEHTDLFNSPMKNNSGIASIFNLSCINIDAAADIKVYYDISRGYDSGTLLSSSDYYIDERNGVLKLFINTVKAPHGLKVTYSGGFVPVDGYLADNIFMEIREACIYQIKYLTTRLRKENVGLLVERGESEQAVATIYSHHGLCYEAARLMNEFRLIKARAV